MQPLSPSPDRSPLKRQGAIRRRVTDRPAVVSKPSVQSGPPPLTVANLRHLFQLSSRPEHQKKLVLAEVAKLIEWQQVAAYSLPMQKQPFRGRTPGELHEIAKFLMKRCWVLGICEGGTRSVLEHILRMTHPKGMFDRFVNWIVGDVSGVTSN